MTTTSEKIEKRYANRRKKIIKSIPCDVAVFASAPELLVSRDMSLPYRQNSDFFYLSGFNEPGAVIVLIGANRGPRSILFLRDRDKTREIWEGERLGLLRAKRRMKFDEIYNISELIKELPPLIKQGEVLHYALGSNSLIDAHILDLYQSNVNPRHNFPHTIKDSRLITSEMRFVKDKEEILSIEHAADITTRGMFELSKQLKSLTSERHAAAQLESHFAKFGATGVGFPTIIAAGKNATCLHHTPQHDPVWHRELVLIDAGALYKGYSGDVSRTLPVSGKFSEPHGEVYDLVEKALQAGISAAKPMNTLDHIHKTVVRTLSRGLIELGLLKGDTNTVVNDESYKEFYMHRSGHLLGLDVHDISPIYDDPPEARISPHSRPLVPGSVFTIEPGLYFDPQNKSIPKAFRGIGIRIEEDIVITDNGCAVLSNRFPTARQEIEAMIS